MPAEFLFTPRSAVNGIVWPAIPAAAGATMLALQFQLEQTQWWPAEVLLQHQFAQLKHLLLHAFETVPFYRERFNACGFDPKADLSSENFAKLPLLTRKDIQEAGENLASTRVPPEHGQAREGRTSGSTGTPVRFLSTEITRSFWQVFTLREQLWHHRNFNAKYAVIRMLPENAILQAWGPATEVAFATGPGVFLKIEMPVSEQVARLKEHQPDYLLTYASNLQALARYCWENEIRLPNLKEVGSIGEVVTKELREDCKLAWGVSLVDIYSTQEVGYIALQCPEYEHYHVQSENVLVEVLNQDGRPCGPGETGRVVVTSLHNFATPFIRYDIGDYAEAGGPCPCGRGLPVLKRIRGRQRNMLVLPSGGRIWPVTGCREYADPRLLRQFQFVQKSLEEIEVRLVTGRALSATEESGLRELILSSLGHPFKLEFVYCDEIPRGPGGKFEDFRSEL